MPLSLHPARCLALKSLCCKCLYEPRAANGEHAVSVTCWLIVRWVPGGFGVCCKRESGHASWLLQGCWLPMLYWHESAWVVIHIKQVNGIGGETVHVVRLSRRGVWNLVAALKCLCINVMNAWGYYKNTYPHSYKCLTFNLLSAALFRTTLATQRAPAEFPRFLILVSSKISPSNPSKHTSLHLSGVINR